MKDSPRLRVRERERERERLLLPERDELCLEEREKPPGPTVTPSPKAPRKLIARGEGRWCLEE